MAPLLVTGECPRQFNVKTLRWFVCASEWAQVRNGREAPCTSRSTSSTTRSISWGAKKTLSYTQRRLVCYAVCGIAYFLTTSLCGSVCMIQISKKPISILPGAGPANSPSSTYFPFGISLIKRLTSRVGCLCRLFDMPYSPGEYLSSRLGAKGLGFVYH